MPVRKISSERKMAATKFLWMLCRLERSLRRIANRRKVMRRATREEETVV